MSIPDKAVEAYVDAYMIEVLSRVDTAGTPSHAAVLAGLEAAEPYLTPTADELDALLWAHRTGASNGTQTACACDRAWRSNTEHRTHLRNVILAAHPEVKS